MEHKIKNFISPSDYYFNFFCKYFSDKCTRRTLDFIITINICHYNWNNVRHINCNIHLGYLIINIHFNIIYRNPNCNQLLELL